MSSQFKKKKNSMVSKQSAINMSRRLASNITNDMKSELNDIGRDNDNIVGSLIGDQDLDRSPADILRNLNESNKRAFNLTNTSNINPRTDLMSNIGLDNIETKNIDKYGNKLEMRDTNPKLMSQMEEDILKSLENVSRYTEPVESKSINRPAPQYNLAKPDELISKRTYGTNRDVVLLVLALKKLAKVVEVENVQLKKENLECKTKEEEYKKKIRTISTRVQELEVDAKLFKNRNNENTKYDLESLDNKLKTLDENLQKATGENSQEYFLEDVVNRNKEYIVKSQENASSMRRLRENLTNLRSTLLTLNTKSM